MSENRFDSAVVVLGMHRSGTSALTGVLRLCGLNVPATLIPSSEANERGFWESEVINALNDSIFEQLGQTWRSIDTLSPSALAPKVRSRVTWQIQETLSAEFADGAVPLIKDPRICRLLPFWGSALARLAKRTVYPFIVRHPVEIARSLGHRNDIDFDHALLLWARYYLDAEGATRGQPRAFIAYTALLADWRATVGSLHASLSLPFDTSTLDEGAIDEYLSGDLRHQVTLDETAFVEGDQMPILAETFEVFSRWAVGSAECEADYERLDNIRGQLDTVGPLLSGVVERVRVERKRRSVALARADEAVANLARANRTLDDLQGVAAQLTKMGEDRRIENAVEAFSALQEERFGDFGRRVRKVLNEANARAQAASDEQKAALNAAGQAIAGLAAETREEAQRSAISIEEVRALVNDRSAIERLTEQNAAVEQQLESMLAGLDERARFDAALANALEQATILRQRILVVEQQEQEARAQARLHLGTIQVRDDEAAAQHERMVAVSDELKTVKRKYRSTQAILARERERLQEVRTDLASAEGTLARYRRSYPWQLYMRVTLLLSRMRRLGDHLPGAGKRREREVALVDQSSLFDRDWYLEVYPDVAASGVDPVTHYLANGWREGRDPGPGFSTTAYLKAHADVAAHGTNPLLHYIEYGHSEGRGAPEHSSPATKTLPPRADFGPAAPCATFALDSDPIVSWQRAGRFDLAAANLFSLPSGLAVGTLTDDNRDAFQRAVEQLATLSGARAIAGVPEWDDDPIGAADLIDAWFAGRNRLRSRWRTTGEDAAIVVRILQQVDGPLEMIGEAFVGDDLDLVDAKLINQYFPVLFVFCDSDGAIRGWRQMAFPSFCRGGLHHAELLALGADPTVRTIDVCAVGARMARQLLAIRAGAGKALIADIAVNLAGADGTHPLFQPHFQRWLTVVAEIAVRPLDTGSRGAPEDYLAEAVSASDKAADPRSGGTLTLRSDMVPSVASLTARAEAGDGDASEVIGSMIVLGEESSKPALLLSPPDSPVTTRSMVGAAFPMLTLPGGLSAPDPAPAYALLMAALRPLSDAERLVPISPTGPRLTSADTPITWVLSPGAWRGDELSQSLESLAYQRDAGRPSIVFSGAPSDAVRDLAQSLFEGRVQTATGIGEVQGLIDTPLAGFVGTSVILHDQRTAAVLTELLDDPRHLSAAVALVLIERRGKGFLVSPIDAGRIITDGTPSLSLEQVAVSLRTLWGSAWSASAPPRDLWLTRTAQLGNMFDQGRASAGEGVHACSSYVTASYCSPRDDTPAAFGPVPTTAQNALRIEQVL